MLQFRFICFFLQLCSLCVIKAHASALSFPVGREVYSSYDRQNDALNDRRRGLGPLSVGTFYYRRTINVTLGTPPQRFLLSLDSSSADLWVPSVESKLCDVNPYICEQVGTFVANQSSSVAIQQSDNFSIGYQNAVNITGSWAKDVLRIGNVTLESHQFGLARESTDLSLGGILGLSWWSDESIRDRKYYSNFMQRLVDTQAIAVRVFSVCFTNRASIQFGGVDRSKYRSPLKFVPLVVPDYLDRPRYFPLSLTGISGTNGSLGNKVQSLYNGSELVYIDTGTIFTFLPKNITDSIYTFANVTFIKGLNLPLVPCQKTASNQTLAFQLGGATGATVDVPIRNFIYDPTTFVPSGIVPEDQCMFALTSLTADGRSLIGDSFFRSAYVVFDMENQQIGLAPLTTNPQNSSIFTLVDRKSILNL